MPQPTPFIRAFNFTDYQASNPSDPVPGYRLDVELDGIAETLRDTLTNLALIQRDDGKLADGCVTVDAVSADLLAAIAAAAPAGPKGDKGDKGDAGTVAVPVFTTAVNTLAPGAAATAAVTGAYPNLLITLGIPKGDAAQAGAATLATGNYGDITVSGAGSVITVNKVLGGSVPSVVGHTHVIADLPGLQATLDAKMLASARGAANGVASLDGAGKVPAAQMPASAVLFGGDGGLEVGQYIDLHNPLADGTDYRARIAVDGTGNINILAPSCALNGVAVSVLGHTHAIADVAGLQAALDGKQPAGAYATTAQLALKADALTAVVTFNADRVIGNGDNGVYLRFIGATPYTATFGNISAGVAVILANRASANMTIVCPGGYFKNGAVPSAANLTLAPNGKITAFHEGGGVWTFDGTDF